MILAEDIGQGFLAGPGISLYFRQALVVKYACHHEHHRQGHAKRADVKALCQDGGRGADYDKAHIDADHDLAKAAVPVAYGRGHVKDGRSYGKQCQDQKDRTQACGQRVHKPDSHGKRCHYQKQYGYKEFAAGNKAALYDACPAYAVFLAVHAKHIVKELVCHVGNGKAKAAAQ